MRVGVYTGSFDPVTKGHEDIIVRCSKLVDKLVVGLIHNVNKKYLFTQNEREEMLKEVFKNYPNIEIKSFDGMVVDFMRANNSKTIFRGLRAVADYEYELTMAYFNSELSEGEIETVFLPASRQYMYLSSSAVREVAQIGGKLDIYVSESVEERVREKYSKER